MTSVLESNGHRSTIAIMNISYAADLWLGALRGKNHSERTLDTYRRLLYKLAEDHARHVDIRDITTVHLRAFLDRQAKRQNGNRKSPATIAQNVSIVNGFFDWVTGEELIPRNPTRRNGEQIISRPRQVRPEDNDNVTTVSTDAVRKLLATANQSPWPERIAVNCLVYLGPRRAALTKLRVRDYDPVSRRLTFQEKGRKTIAKPVPHELAQVIEAAIIAGVYQWDDDYLVPSRASQRRKGDRDDRIIWRLVTDTAKRAGVVTHVHALRAAFAVHFLETHPGELIALQKLMGHERQETTLVYLRRLDRQQQMETVRDLSWSTESEDEQREHHPGTTDRGDGGTAGAGGASGGRRDLHPSEAASGVDQAGLDRRDDVLGEAGATAGIGGSGDGRDRVRIPQIAEEPLEAKPVTEKEGFEPSFDAKPHPQRAGSEHAADAPVTAGLDAALLEKVRAITERVSEVVE